jgi:hypothetical protein
MTASRMRLSAGAGGPDGACSAGSTAGA